MRHRMIILVAACVLASTAAAQTAPLATDKSDSWAKPVPASSVITSAKPSRLADKPAASPFKFKSDERARPADQLPPSPNDKATVMGKDRPWQNGQAPVDCANSPHSSGC